MFAYLRMWNAPDIKLNCKEIIVKEGVNVPVDGEDTQMLMVICGDGIYHPVVDVEIL